MRKDDANLPEAWMGVLRGIRRVCCAANVNTATLAPFWIFGRRSCVVLLWRGNDVAVVVAGRVDDVVVKQAEGVSETAKAPRRARCSPLPQEWLV